MDAKIVGVAAAQKQHSDRLRQTQEI